MLSIGGVMLFVVGIVLQVLTFRKRRPVRPVATWVGQGSSILAMAVYSAIVARPPGPIEWVLLLGVGFPLGWLYGRLVKVERAEAGVVMSYTLPWLIVWGAILTCTQLLSIVSGHVPVVLYSAGILSAGLNVGMHANVLGVARRLPAQAVVASLVVVGVLGLAALVAGPLGPSRAVASNPLDKIAPQLRPLIIASGGTINQWETMTPVSSTDDQIELHYGTDFTLSDDTRGWSTIWVVWFRDAADASEEYRTEARWVENENRELGQERSHVVLLGNVLVRNYASYSSGYSSLKQLPDELMDATKGQYDAVVAAAGHVDWNGVLAFYHLRGTQPSSTSGGASGGSSGGGATISGSGSTGGRDLGAQIADFYANKTVPIEQQAEATGTAGGILALGSVLQALIAFGGARRNGAGGGPTPAIAGPSPTPSTPLAVDPLAGAARSADGSVYYRAPWDEAGAAWMTEEDARRVAEMESQGCRWTNQWGWVSGDQEAGYESAHASVTAAAHVHDAELAATEQRIREARAGVAAAEANQKRLTRVGELWNEQRALERQMAVDGADAEQWDRVATAANQIKGIADFSVNVAGSYGGPLGRGIRASYNYASGVAEGYGNYLAEDTDYLAKDTDRPAQLLKHLVRGSAIGAVKAGATEAIDFGLTKAAKAVPGIVNYVRGVPSPGPVPPSLLTAKAALRQLTDPERAVATKDVLTFVKNGGMRKVAQLEALGHAPASQVQALVKVVTGEVDGAVTQGAKDAYGVWNRSGGCGSGVRVARVLVGDAGSSSSGALRSAATDADRTVWAVFDKKDLATYSAKNGITEAEATMQLNKSFAGTADDSVRSALDARNIDPATVDFKTYSGFGGSAGPDDTYPLGDALVRQAAGGRTTVVSQTTEGALVTHASSGRTLTDEYMIATGRGASDAPSIATTELLPLAKRQAESIVAHTDMKSLAKAITRLAYVDGRAEVVAVEAGPAMDPAIRTLARLLRADPQGAADILRRAGLTESEFRDEAFRAASRVLKRAGALLG